MSRAKRKPPHISQEDWDAVDSPPLSDDFIRGMRPTAEVAPDVVADYLRRRGRPKSEEPKQLVSLRLDPNIVRAFREDGPGWQTRINEVLAKAVKKRKARG